MKQKSPPDKAPVMLLIIESRARPADALEISASDAMASINSDLFTEYSPFKEFL